MEKINTLVYPLHTMVFKKYFSDIKKEVVPFRCVYDLTFKHSSLLNESDY